MEEKLIVTFIGMEPTEALRSKALDQFSKHDDLLKHVTKLEIFLKQRVQSRGVLQDFIVEVNANVPRSRVHVEEMGDDMYALLDRVSDVFYRRLRRYFDKKQNWEGSTPWRVLESEDQNDMQEEEIDDFAHYTPVIVERSVMEYLSPMEEAEAIERMELEGRSSYLFRRVDGKWCMVYQLPGSVYGVIEQGSDKM
jgi:ribosomal subunit interface protein